MTTGTESDIQSAELEVSTAQPPAPGADEQKPTAPASDADVQNPDAAETPEQVAAKQESRRARSNARKAAQLADARAEAKLLREDRDRLNAKLEAQSKQTQETGEPQRNDIDPKTGQPYSYEEYLERRTDWRADQKVDARLKAERDAQQGKEKQEKATAGSDKVAKDWTDREKSFQAATKDYEAVVQPFADEELQNFSQQARMSIVESDVGPALLYHLAKNPEEADRIAELSPTRQVAELGKLETKVSMPAKKTTNAPPPASTTTGGKTSTKTLESAKSQEEYEALRKSQGARWAR